MVSGGLATDWPSEPKDAGHRTVRTVAVVLCWAAGAAADAVGALAAAEAPRAVAEAITRAPAAIPTMCTAARLDPRDAHVTPAG